MNSKKRGKKPPPAKPPEKVRKARVSYDSDSSTSTLPIPGRRVDVERETERFSSLNLGEFDDESSIPSSPSVFYIEETDSESELEVKDVHVQLVFQDEKLLREIFQHLDHSSRVTATLVCKHWDSVARPIILSQQLQLNQFMVGRMGHLGSKIRLGYMKTMGKRGKVHTSILYDCRIEEFLEESERFPNLLAKFGDQLKKLDLHWLSRRLPGNEEFWLKGIRNLKNLEELVILDSWHAEGYSTFRPSFSLESVKKLILVAKLYPETVEKNEDVFDEVRRLTNNDEHIKDIVAPTLLSLCRNMEILSIQGPSYPVIDYIRENALEKLKKLHLFGARSGLVLTDDSLHSVYLLSQDYALSELTLSLFLLEDGEESTGLASSPFGTISALRLSIILKKYAKTLNYLHLNEIKVCEKLEKDGDKEDEEPVKIPIMKDLSVLKLTYKNESPFHKCRMDKHGNLRELKKAKKRFDNLRPMIEFVFDTKGSLGLNGERLKVDFGLQFPSLNVIELGEALCQNQCDPIMEKVVGPAFRKAFLPCVGMPRVTGEISRGSLTYAYGTLYDRCDCCRGATPQTTGKCVVM